MHSHDLVTMYPDYLRAANASTRTIEARVGGARRLMTIAETDDTTGITTMHAIRYVASVPAPASRVAYYHNVAGLARFLLATGEAAVFLDGVPKPHAPRGVPRPLPPEVIGDALGICDRDTAMMILLPAFAGLRVSEVAAVRGEDLSDGNLYVTGKGGRPEMIPAHPLIVDAAQDFPDRGWWFPGNKPGHHVTRGTVWKWITTALRAVGSNGRPHQLRHSYGTLLLENGTDIRTLQSLLRHKSLSTTETYTRVTDNRRRAAIDRLQV